MGLTGKLEEAKINERGKNKKVVIGEEQLTQCRTQGL